jgi:hypothetical protein
VGLEPLHIGRDLLCSGTQARLNHLGCFKVVAIDGDGFRYNSALFVGRSVDVYLESGDKDHIGHLLLVQAKKPPVIFRSRIVGEDDSLVSVRGLHKQRFSGPGSDHSFYLVISGKGRYRCKQEQGRQTYYNRFVGSLHDFLISFWSLNLLNKFWLNIDLPVFRCAHVNPSSAPVCIAIICSSFVGITQDETLLRGVEIRGPFLALATSSSSKPNQEEAWQIRRRNLRRILSNAGREYESIDAAQYRGQGPDLLGRAVDEILHCQAGLWFAAGEQVAHVAADARDAE